MCGDYSFWRKFHCDHFGPFTEKFYWKLFIADLFLLAKYLGIYFCASSGQIKIPPPCKSYVIRFLYGFAICIGNAHVYAIFCSALLDFHTSGYIRRYFIYQSCREICKYCLGKDIVVRDALLYSCKAVLSLRILKWERHKSQYTAIHQNDKEDINWKWNLFGVSDFSTFWRARR